MDNLSQAVSFRVTPQTKMALHEKSTALGMTMSEYLNSIISEHSRLKEELVKKDRSLHEIASETLMQYSSKKEIEIRDQERARLALSPQAYQLPKLQKLYEKLEDKEIVVTGAFGSKRTIRVNSIYLLVEAMLDNFDIVIENTEKKDFKTMIGNRNFDIDKKINI
jgi:hypothetical protein